MATGDVLRKYAASSALTVTNLQSIATSSTWVAGWSSAVIDNGTTGYEDIHLTAKIIVAAAGLAAGQIRMYIAPVVDDTPTYAANFDGTQKALTFMVDTEMQDAWMHLAAVTITDTGASDSYYLDCPSVRAIMYGNLPRYFQVAIAHNTGANLAAAGNLVSIQGNYFNVA